MRLTHLYSVFLTLYSLLSIPSFQYTHRMAEHILRWGLLGTARINRSVISPLRNSPRNKLTAVCSRSADKVKAYADEWEIVLVDDASSDSSDERTLELTAQSPYGQRTSLSESAS